MAQPTPYDRQFSFQDFQAQEPTTPLPGDEVDGEFNAVKLTIDQTLVNLAKIQRDDGALKNGIVTQDSLSDSLSIGFTYRGSWVSGVNYLISDGASVGSTFYKARSSHLSSGLNQPPNAAFWDPIADFTPLAIGVDSIFTAAIQDGAVTEPKHATGGVSTRALADGALAASTSGLAKMADGYLAASTAGRAKMADGFLSASTDGLAKMADGYLAASTAGRAKIADGYFAAAAGSRAKFADKFLPLAKIDDVSTAVVLGRTTASSGPIEELDAADIRGLIATAIGSALLVAADTPAARLAILAPAAPQTASGIGQVTALNPGDNTNLVAPVGGTWFWLSFSFSTAGTNIAQGLSCGVAAGAAIVKAGTVGQSHTGVFWRIA